MSPFIEIEEFCAAADWRVIDENPGNCVVLAALLHFYCLEMVIGDIILDKRHPFDAKQFLGAMTVSAIEFGINFDFATHNSKIYQEESC